MSRSRAGSWFVLHGQVWLFAVVGAASCGLTIWLWNPGYMSTDSAGQLTQARAFEFTDHHPLVMSVLWHFVEQLVPGPIGMLVLNSVLSWFGLTAVIATLRWPIWLRALAIPALGFFPPVFCIAGAIWKDTLMHAALIAAVGSFLIFDRVRGWLPLAFSGICCVLALVVRHNSVAATWPVLGLLLIGVVRFEKVRKAWRVLGSLGAALVLALLLSITLNRLTAAAYVTKTNFWQLIATFDIAAVSIAKGEMMFDANSPVLRRGVTVRELARTFRIRNHMAPYSCEKRRCTPVLTRSYDEAELAKLAENWRRVVLAEPLAYLTHRARFYEAASGFDGSSAKLSYHSRTKYRRAYPLSNNARVAQRWMVSQFASGWFKAWIYLGLSLSVAPIAAVLALLGRSPLPLVFSLSSISYAASVFFGAGAPDYRYSEWTVFAGILAVITLAQPHLFRKPASDVEAPRASGESLFNSPNSHTTAEPGP